MTDPSNGCAARVLALIEEATQADPGSMRTTTVLKEHEGWDSLGAVMFIGLVQEHLGVELSVADLRASETVGDLQGCVERRRAGAVG